MEWFPSESLRKILGQLRFIATQVVSELLLDYSTRNPSSVLFPLKVRTISQVACKDEDKVDRVLREQITRSCGFKRRMGRL